MNRRTALIMALLAAGTLGGAWWLADGLVERRWREANHRIALARSRWEARDFTRPGAAESGSAWEAYERALAITAQMPAEDVERLFPEPDPESPISSPLRVAPADRRELLERYRDAITWLRRGAARAHRRPRIELARGFDGLAEIGEASSLATLAQVAAHAVHDADPHEAVAIFADTMVFGTDVAIGPTLIHEIAGWGIIGSVVSESLTEELLATLPAPALRQLGRAAESIDRTARPELENLESDLVALAAHATGGELLPPHSTVAQYVPLLMRYLTAAALLDVAALAERTTSHASAGWPARQAHLETCYAPHRSSTNPITRVILPNAESVERSKRVWLAELRLLRMAVAWHLGDDVEPLADPLGEGPLAIAAEAAGTVFRSRGHGHTVIARRVGPR